MLHVLSTVTGRVLFTLGKSDGLIAIDRQRQIRRDLQMARLHRIGFNIIDCSLLP